MFIQDICGHFHMHEPEAPEMNATDLTPLQQQRAEKICRQIDAVLKDNSHVNPADIAKPYIDSIFNADPKLFVYLVEKYEVPRDAFNGGLEP